MACQQGDAEGLDPSPSEPPRMLRDNVAAVHR